jgi:ectoine hydroxylase-related dioxygenase (phytanoyl-CoA dioxygenase family)
VLDSAAIDAYEADGVVAVRGLLDDAWIQTLVDVWLCLEPVTAQTGAIRVVRGSQLDDDETARVGKVPEIDSDRVAIVETQPGDVVAFHPRALHTGYGSSPDRPRRTFTIRFMGDDVRWRPRREYFHEWMRDCGLAKGAPPDHAGFPVVWSVPTTSRVRAC